MVNEYAGRIGVGHATPEERAAAAVRLIDDTFGAIAIGATMLACQAWVTFSHRCIHGAIEGWRLLHGQGRSRCRPAQRHGQDRDAVDCAMKGRLSALAFISKVFASSGLSNAAQPSRNPAS
jgi:hypothetical protein